MSGLKRTFERQQQKQRYTQFKKAWKTEKAYQIWANGEDGPKLGRCPTFTEWKIYLSEQAKNLAKQPEQVQQEIPDLEWPEE